MEAFVFNVIQSFSLQMIISAEQWKKVKKVESFQNILVFVLSPFCFNDSIYSSCMDSTSSCKTCWLILSRHYVNTLHDVLVMSKDACFSQSSSAPINVESGWGQVTAAVTRLLGLLWFSSSSIKALRCVWAHNPAAVWSQAKSRLK